MGMFARVLLIIWFIGGTAGSIYLLTKRFLQIGVRVVHLHSQICLEDTVWWPTLLLTLVCVSCILGLMSLICCKVKSLQWLVSILVNVGIICVMAVMIWRLLMFGWLRKPIPMAFDEVYKSNSPLDEEYKPMLIEAMASDHMWARVEKCLSELQFCEEAPGPPKLFGKEDWKIENYYEYFKEGCCVPPPRCSRQLDSFKGVSNEDDCLKWGNATAKKQQHVKCYDCNSCKAARMATYQTNEDKVRMYSVIVAIFLFVASLFSSMGAFD